jgi:hypothetical protein
MTLLGYLAAILMGLLLGLLGGGGSILTVPILVYLFHMDAVDATAYSLFIVGATSAVGSISQIRHGNIRYRTALVFGIPSVTSIFLTRKFLVPAIPPVLATIGTFTLTKHLAILLVFAVLMIAAAWSMIRKKPQQQAQFPQGSSWQTRCPRIAAEGLVVGMITGLVGAGGGFIIIPALISLAGLEMKQAVATSLMIISMNAFIGFIGDLTGPMNIDWTFLAGFTAAGIVGILAGTRWARHISNERLKPVFGWFVLVMGIYIILKELFFADLH